MRGYRPMRIALVLSATVIMVVSSLFAIGVASATTRGSGGGPASVLADGSSPALPSQPRNTGFAPSDSVVSRIHADLAADHVPARDVFLPNLNARVPVVDQAVAPLYSEAPAPMGLGDFGLAQVGGKNVGSISYTSSVEGVLQLDQLNATYLDGNGPDSVSIQLNTVLTNVDLFGNTSNQFWIQNVPVYIPHLDQLSIVDNIWNFSSPAFNFTASSLYSDDGVVIAPVYYFANGPTFHTAMPFTVRVYNNATLFHNRPTVYLNYSVTEANGTTFSGSYDRVVFNSTAARHATSPAPEPTFQINGREDGANGYLPNDAELMLGGSDDGSTTSISNVQGIMQLLTLPNGTSTYRSVPAAYDFGTDTGETTEGMAEWASSGPVPAAHLGPGPSFLVPLWGLKGAVFGHIDQDLQISPSNAFVFVSPGPSFRAGTAQWGATLVSGQSDYALPPGTYTYKVLFSEYRPATFTLTGSSSVTVTLRSDPSLGVYTPLWAWNNAQLAAISQPGGAGTKANPYVLINTPGTIDPLFGTFNDFQFPDFMGVFLTYTTDYVTVENAPSFLVQYSLPGQLAALSAYGLPSFNYLQFEFQNASHVSVVDNPVISGWFSAFNIGESLGSLLLWNSSHDLVAANNFEDMGVSIYVAGGSGNIFWGNTFTVSVPACADPYDLLNYTDAAGVELFASGDLTYNNYFDVPLPAVTPTYVPASFVGASFFDQWNVTREPASDFRWMNGWKLSGSILGTSYQGGNFWSNYGSPSDPYGVLPYNDGGQITKGGDHVPLLPYVLHRVTFTEHGLPSGGLWSVTVNGYMQRSWSSTITFWEPNGVYAYTVHGDKHSSPTSSHGAFDVAGHPAAVSVRFV
ncbi:MAG: thermopsin [Thermoplasmata archaeon]|nr:thermopsin [Thermoplasmata archaeon]